ncbi:uncharacterized protein BDZ99DRAFT_546914 [Mytilinidion resinicola]|uniref:Uncharacterized protein n=1 Tax=Mytilinidion resinicola TaxID=574789 RepID=A0A6A6Y4T4_9PEZI|nr:uncharacterized protein BDZ99DRAFT_546914 [Mytilinidion resinicola]KAF2803639.1 hypothetical protein BDZ99DRAFT_546914 [Mytilinidion resinicola]
MCFTSHTEFYSCAHRVWYNHLPCARQREFSGLRPCVPTPKPDVHHHHECPECRERKKEGLPPEPLQLTAADTPPHEPEVKCTAGAFSSTKLRTSTLAQDQVPITSNRLQQPILSKPAVSNPTFSNPPLSTHNPLLLTDLSTTFDLKPAYPTLLPPLRKKPSAIVTMGVTYYSVYLLCLCGKQDEEYLDETISHPSEDPNIENGTEILYHMHGCSDCQARVEAGGENVIQRIKELLKNTETGTRVGDRHRNCEDCKSVAELVNPVYKALGISEELQDSDAGNVSSSEAGLMMAAGKGKKKAAGSS